MVAMVLMLCLVAAQGELARPRVAINEVMANPEGSAGAHHPEDRNEFIELYNLSDDTIDLQGWCLTDFDAVDTICAWTDTMIRVKYPHVRTHCTTIMPHYYALILDPEYTDPAPESGYVQPYRFSDRLLLLKPGNTTIGNGLANSDPIMIWSPDSSEVSAFGCGEGGESLPHDAGDGISWERTSPDAPDCDTCWYRCRDTAGSTPGRANSIATYLNLTCCGLLCYPLSYVPDVPETVRVTIRNSGRVTAREWSVRVSRVRDGPEDSPEEIASLSGTELPAGQTAVLTGQWQDPEPGRHELLARLVCPGDQNAGDDQASLALDLTRHRQNFNLSTDCFGPNLETAPQALVISYSLPDARGRLLIRVFDLNGRLRATIHDRTPPTKDGQVSWTGTDRPDQTGSLLPTGLYIIACEYKSGKEVLFEKKTAVLAKGPR
jgi:hypothetical protein